MAKEMSIYNYDQDGAPSITHFAPDTVTAAGGVYILDRRAAWTVEPGLVEGCPSCLQAAGQDADQDADQAADQVRTRWTTTRPSAAAPAPAPAALATTWALPGARKRRLGS